MVYYLGGLLPGDLLSGECIIWWVNWVYYLMVSHLYDYKLWLYATYACYFTQSTQLLYMSTSGRYIFIKLSLYSNWNVAEWFQEWSS